jgi:hypothetical protein
MRRKLDFLLKLGPALMVSHGMQSAKAEDVYTEAEQIGTATSNDEATFKAKWGLWLTANIAQKSALARDRAQDLVAFARRFGESDLLLEAYHCRWSTAIFRGDVKETIENGRIGAETYNIDRHRHLGHAFGGHDPGVCAHGMCALAYQMSGEAKQAERHIAQCVALGEALDQPNSLGMAWRSM